MDELSGANAFFEQRLLEDADLVAERADRLYEGEAPEGTDADPTEYPLQVYQFMSGKDVLAQGAARIYTDCLFLVKTIGRAGFGEITAAVTRTDALLHQAQVVPVTIAGVDFLATCYRERPWQRSSTSDGVRYYERGGVYRLYVSLAP